MALRTGAEGQRYRAFISYASADRGIGERFHRGLEHFRIPRAFRGTDRGHGPVPARLTPIFRDRSDADASPDLGGVLRTALERSDALVVLCSPSSAQSRWVNEEIRFFRSLGRAARVLPVLVGGTAREYHPDLSPDGAFPPALFESASDDHARATRPAGPLAPDLRPEGDGFDMARLKTIAALTGVPLTELTQRQFEAERRERRIVRGVALVMAVLAIAATVSAVQAWRSAAEARARLENAIEMNARRLDEAVRFQDAYGVPVEVVRQLLDRADEDYRTLVGPTDTATPALELQRGRLLVLLSQLHRALGDTQHQLALAEDAVAVLQRVRTTRALLTPASWFVAVPAESVVQRERLQALENRGLALLEAPDRHEEAALIFENGRRLASEARLPDLQARFWSRLSEVRYATGDTQGALDAVDRAIDLLETGGDNAPGDAALERALARSERAQLLLESERPREAMDEQVAVVAALETYVAAAPNDTDRLRNLGHALARHGDMRYAVTGSWRESIPEFERARVLFERAYDSDRSRVDYARDLAIVLERLGDARLQMGDVQAAAPLFDRCLAIRRDRYTRDTANADARRDLAVALERQADLALANSTPRNALAPLDEARALRTDEPSDVSAADADPVLVRDLAVLWAKTGQARSAAGDRGWQTAFQSAIDLLAPLVGVPSAPPGWLRDLAVFHASYGDALGAARDRDGARREWRTALTLVDRQRTVNPDDPRLAADRAILLQRLK